jgi:CHASE2 domain-containing sensor protein
MVRERVGDWRLAWRFALAGLVAGLLVAVLSTLGVASAPFFAAQDQLFPAPEPNQSVTFIAFDSKSQKDIGAYPLPSNGDNARIINYLASLHPSVILFDVVLDGQTPPDPETPKVNNNLQLASAMGSYETYKRQYAQQSVFAAAQPTET